MPIPSWGLGHPAPAPSPLLSLLLHTAPLQVTPRACFLGASRKKRLGIIVPSPEVLSPHEGVVAPFPSVGAGRAHEAGVGLELGSLCPSAPRVHRRGGFLLPQQGPTRSWCHPTCCGERRGPGCGGFSVRREVGWGRGLPCSKMAPCEPLCEGQQDVAGEQQSPASSGRRGGLWGAPAAVLPGREAGWGAKHLCSVLRGVPLCLEGLTTLFCGVWCWSVTFDEKEVLYTVSRYSSKEKLVKKEKKNLRRKTFDQVWQGMRWGGRKAAKCSLGGAAAAPGEHQLQAPGSGTASRRGGFLPELPAALLAAGGGPGSRAGVKIWGIFWALGTWRWFSLAPCHRIVHWQGCWGEDPPTSAGAEELGWQACSEGICGIKNALLLFCCFARGIAGTFSWEGWRSGVAGVRYVQEWGCVNKANENGKCPPPWDPAAISCSSVVRAEAGGRRGLIKASRFFFLDSGCWCSVRV